MSAPHAQSDPLGHEFAGGGGGSRVEGDRSRTLVVRDGHGLGEFVQTLHRSAPAGQVVEEVDDVYDALAELGGLRGGISAIALPLRAAGDEPRVVREAFRRVDPAVRMVLVAPRGAGAIAEGAGFDAVVFLPASSRDIVEALAPSGLQPAPESAEEMGEVLPRPTREGLKPPATAGAGDRSESTMAADRRAGTTNTARAAEPPRRETRDVVDLVVDDALQAFAARRARPTAAPSTSSEMPPKPALATAAQPAANLESIGDTDLADAVAEGGGRLLAVAIELIRHELHIDDLRLAADRESRPDARASDTVVPVTCHGESFGYLVSATASAESLASWADWLGHWLRLDRMHEELRILAWTDELTGAGNRRAFERVIDDTIATARAERRPVSLMYFDIDNFKTYNDRFGHEAGDEVLRETVELLRSVIRRGDHVFRVGGDEFVVIFADSRGARAGGAPAGAFESIETIATRFRERVSALKLPQLGLDAPGTVSISAGVATYPWDGHDAHSLLQHADQLSLQSKRCGKNTITFGPGAKNHCGDA